PRRGLELRRGGEHLRPFRLGLCRLERVAPPAFGEAGLARGRRSFRLLGVPPGGARRAPPPPPDQRPALPPRGPAPAGLVVFRRAGGLPDGVREGGGVQRGGLRARLPAPEAAPGGVHPAVPQPQSDHAVRPGVSGAGVSDSLFVPALI